MDGLNGNGLLKRYAFSMEDKMAAGAFGRERIMGETAPLRCVLHNLERINS